MKKGIKGTLFVLLYLALSFITQALVTLGAIFIGAMEIMPGLNLAERSDVAVLTESITLWLSEYSPQIMIISNLLLVGALLLILLLREIPLKKRLGNGKLSLRNIFGSLFLLSGSGVLVAFLLSLPILAPYMETHEELMTSLTTGHPLFVFLSLGIMAPLAEELTFRAMVYREMKTFMPPWLGILLSALLFGVFHGNLVQGTYAFFLGILLAAAYEKTDSFAVPLLMHILFNSLNFVPTLIWNDGSALLSVMAGLIWFVWGWKLLRKKAA